MGREKGRKGKGKRDGEVEGDMVEVEGEDEDWDLQGVEDGVGEPAKVRNSAGNGDEGMVLGREGPEEDVIL